MRLLVQPEAGLAPIVQALDGALESVDILIFRLEAAVVEEALLRAARRGVTVTALLTLRRPSGRKELRRLEARLRVGGVRVVRTAGDLVRYHGKMLIVDHRTVYVLAFNFTEKDMLRSRSFGVALSTAEVVREAERLFQADCERRAFRSESRRLLVSPANAREGLLQFLRAATRQILIYDVKLRDPEFVELLRRKAASGVEVRVISRRAIKRANFAVRVAPVRLHARAMVRDGVEAYVGSMSLRRLELTARREIGVLFEERAAVQRLAEVFEQDWAAGATARRRGALRTEWPHPAKLAKRLARRLASSLQGKG